MFRIHKILNNNFSKNTIQYVFGIGLAQLIAFGFQFILRRIYTQEDFGNYAIFTSIVSIITVVSTLRYERAIILPKENVKAYRLLVVAIFFAVCINLLIFLIILIFPNQLAKVFNVARQNAGFFYLIPVSGLLFSVFRVFEFFLTRKKAYLQIGGSKVIRRLTEGSFQYILKITKKSGLFLGDIVGHFVNFMYGLFLVRKDLYSYRKESIQFKEPIQKYKDFPKYNLWTALAQDLNTVFLPVFLISYFFGTAVTGNYDLARLLLSVPLSLITVAIQQILFQKLSEIVNAGETIARHLLKLLFVLLIVATIGTLLFFIFIDDIVLLFGDKWVSTIGLAKILVFSYLIKFVLDPFSSIFFVLKKLKVYSIWQTIYFFLIVSLFLISFKNLNHFLYFLVGIDILFYCIQGIILYTIVLQYQRSLNSN